MSIIRHEFIINEDGKRECRACGSDFWPEEDIIVDCDPQAMIDILVSDRTILSSALERMYEELDQVYEAFRRILIDPETDSLEEIARIGLANAGRAQNGRNPLPQVWENKNSDL